MKLDTDRIKRKITQLDSYELPFYLERIHILEEVNSISDIPKSL